MRLFRGARDALGTITPPGVIVNSLTSSRGLAFPILAREFVVRGNGRCFVLCVLKPLIQGVVCVALVGLCGRTSGPCTGVQFEVRMARLVGRQILHLLLRLGAPLSGCFRPCVPVHHRLTLS